MDPAFLMLSTIGARGNSDGTFIISSFVTYFRVYLEKSWQ